MNQDNLQKIRSDIIARTQTLALNGNVDDNDKLVVLMNIIRLGNFSDEIMTATFDAIEHLSEDNTKLETYLDLLYEVDQRIASQNQTEVDDTTPQSDQEPHISSEPNQINQ